MRGAARMLHLVGHVERHADERDRLCGDVAFHDAAHEHVAPGSVRTAVARLDVDRFAGQQRLGRRRSELRHVVRVGVRTRFGERQAVGPVGNAEDGEAVVVVVQAVGGEVVAPEDDVRQLGRQIELRGHAVRRPGGLARAAEPLRCRPPIGKSRRAGVRFVAGGDVSQRPEALVRQRRHPGAHPQRRAQRSAQAQFGALGDHSLGVPQQFGLHTGSRAVHEPLVGPDDVPRGIGQGQQVGALFEPRRQQGGVRGRRKVAVG